MLSSSPLTSHSTAATTRTLFALSSCSSLVVQQVEEICNRFLFALIYRRWVSVTFLLITFKRSSRGPLLMKKMRFPCTSKSQIFWKFAILFLCWYGLAEYIIHTAEYMYGIVDGNNISSCWSPPVEEFSFLCFIFLCCGLLHWFERPIRRMLCLEVHRGSISSYVCMYVLLILYV